VLDGSVSSALGLLAGSVYFLKEPAGRQRYGALPESRSGTHSCLFWGRNAGGLKHPPLLFCGGFVGGCFFVFLVEALDAAGGV
jgi:hypothetical protein